MQIVTLDTSCHRRQDFDCGEPALNRFLQQMAGQQSARYQNRTYVLAEETVICGFYTLALIRPELDGTPANIQKKYRLTQAVGLVARLAVDKRYQGQGLGGILLHDALIRLEQAASAVGFPMVFVDAKDGKSAFYEQYGFIPCGGNRLFMMIDTIRANFAHSVTLQ